MTTIFRILSLIAALSLVSVLSLPALAQPGMSQAVHRVIDAANGLLQEGEEGRAVEELQGLVERGGLNDYEEAVTRQVLGFAHYSAGDPGQAREAFETALSFDALPDPVTTSVRMTLSQICLELGELPCARDQVERVISSAGEANPEHLGMAAHIYYELGEYDTAERHVLTAIDLAKEPQEHWYQVLLAIYREQEAWDKAESVLRDVIATYPDNGNYWQFFSYVLFVQDKLHEALASLMLAWRLDLLDAGELERIVGFHANLGIPEKAARLLEQWLETGTLEASTERTATLGRLWLMARERDKATDALARAADESDEAEYDLLLGKLHYEQQNWEPSMRHLETALEKDGLSGNEIAEARLLLGISAYHSGRTDIAASAFEAAGRDPRHEDHARYWLNRLEEEAAGG